MTELLANFHFLRPAWLLAALPVLPVGWLLYRRLGAGKAWSAIISQQLLPHLLSGGRATGRWPLAALLVAWLLTVVALAGPSWERLPQPVERREHALVVLYDLSLSMYATDITPSRLVRSRQKLLDLLENKTEGTTGLIAYAGDAHVVSPLTDDLRTIANLMPALTPDIMPVKGSRPARAVEQAVRLLRDSGLEHGQILLVTDGVYRGDSDEIAEALGNTRYRLSVLGIGTSEGSPIPTGEGFLRDAQGGIVVAGLERQPLKALAARFGGSYSDLELGDKDLEQILALDPFAEDDSLELLGRSVDTWEDMGYWLTLLLLPVALGAFRRGYVLCLLLLPLAAPTEAADLRGYFLNRDQRGSGLLQAEEAEAAAELFQDPAWKATANYRAGRFDKALELYQQDDSADGWYNRGNSLARTGKLDEAIAAYNKALELKPDMEDAAFNKSLLEQLQQQQEQQQQNQDQQNQDQNQDQQQQDQQSRQQDQQSPGGEQDQQQQQAQNQPSEAEDPQDSEQQQQQAEQEQRDQQQAEAQPGEQEPGEQQQQAARERDADELEREMANEQWLRRIPDDPSGLLRRKFRYQSRLRAEENPRGADADEDSRW